jgi:hypothetical protein
MKKNFFFFQTLPPSIFFDFFPLVSSRSLFRSFVRSFVYSFVYSFVCSFVRLFVCSFVRLFIRSFIRSFPHLAWLLLLHALPPSRLTVCQTLLSFVKCAYLLRKILDKTLGTTLTHKSAVQIFNFKSNVPAIKRLLKYSILEALSWVTIIQTCDKMVLKVRLLKS